MKLQPEFSFQKYESNKEDQSQQFQYQLQQEHIQVSNTTNSTIDDLSFWPRERMTSFTWVNSKPIFTKTVALVAWTVGGTVNTFSLGITEAFTIINSICYVSDGTTSMPIPNDTINLTITNAVPGTATITAGVDMSAFTGFLTVFYIKT